MLDLVLACGGALGSLGYVGEMDLSDLVRHSDAVVVAKVATHTTLPLDPKFAEANHLFSRLGIGELEVDLWLKGEPGKEPLVFINDGTWTCDITGAEVGERSLYFLGTPSLGRETARHLGGYDLKFGNRTLLGVLHAGCGQMGLRKARGRELATVWDNVVLPKDAPILPGPDAGSDFIRSVPVDWLTAQVRSLVEAQRRPHLRLQAHPGERVGLRWNLSVRFDRTAELIADGPQGIETRRFIVDSGVAWKIDRVLQDTTAFEDRVTIGTEPCDRRITIWANESELTFSLGDLTGLADSDRAQAAAKIWTALRSSFEFPECIDHRAADREALERR